MARLCGLGKRLWPIWAILGASALLALLCWAAVVLPQRLLDTRGLSSADRLGAENALRGTLVTLLGAVAVIGGGVLAALNLVLVQRLQWRAQVAERFSRAVEQLGQADESELDVRLGAIYALEQIARDSADLHWPIMEVLTAHLRERTSPALAAAGGPDPGDEEDAEGPPPEARAPADVQAIATVIGRRRWQQDPPGQRLDLHGACLDDVQWIRARLDGAYLWGTRLERADLRGSRLRDAILVQADLEGAALVCARLEGAALAQARLPGADLRWASLRRGDLSQAQLLGAYLGGAQLQGANLRWARLEGADLDGARLGGADLDGTWLSGANLDGVDLAQTLGLTATQLQAARNVDATRLPAGLQGTAEPEPEAPAEPAAEPGAPSLPRSGTEG